MFDFSTRKPKALVSLSHLPSNRNNLANSLDGTKKKPSGFDSQKEQMQNAVKALAFYFPAASVPSAESNK